MFICLFTFPCLPPFGKTTFLCCWIWLLCATKMGGRRGKKATSEVEKYCDYAWEHIVNNGKPMMIRKHTFFSCQYALREPKENVSIFNLIPALMLKKNQFLAVYLQGHWLLTNFQWDSISCHHEYQLNHNHILRWIFFSLFSSPSLWHTQSISQWINFSLVFLSSSFSFCFLPHR